MVSVVVSVKDVVFHGKGLKLLWGEKTLTTLP